MSVQIEFEKAKKKVWVPDNTLCSKDDGNITAIKDYPVGDRVHIESWEDNEGCDWMGWAEILDKKSMSTSA
jgi:hypothetical protein